MDLPELLSSPSMWSHGFPAIRVTQERPLERALIVRNSSRRGRNWRGTGSFSVELHVTTLSTPPGGPRGPPEHVPRPGQGRVHIVDSPTTRVLKRAKSKTNWWIDLGRQQRSSPERPRVRRLSYCSCIFPLGNSISLHDKGDCAAAPSLTVCL